ncbi:MAG: YraN family protein [Candidatus Omnitrophota bacterium]|nr:MAG: YraN family protein [Candidatus Omnitrophota bacterium]
MRKSENLRTARRGEEIAARHLQTKGYRLIEQNYRTRYAEIDLITRYKGILVFVEVRTKRNEQFGSPEETINRNKINKLIKNAQGYMLKKGYNKKYRIDAVCVLLDKNGEAGRISHYENITL